MDTLETSLKQILEKIFRNERSLIITLPSTTSWKDYEKELRKAANYSHVLNFKVHNFPKGICCSQWSYQGLDGDSWFQ